MATRDISKPEQVSSAKTNPEINETLEGLPKKLEKEQVGGEHEFIKKRLLLPYDARSLMDSERSFESNVYVGCYTPSLTKGLEFRR